MAQKRWSAPPASRHPQAGFTLVEVMAAIAILAIGMTAVFATFSSQQRSFTVQSRVSEMQQNLRQAVEFISRDIRLAGYGIPDNVAIPNNVVAAGVTSMHSIYAKDNTTAPDQIYILYQFDMDANQPPTSTSTGVPANASTVTVASTTGFLDSGGELVLVTDGTTADLYETTAASGTALTFGGGSAYNSGHTTSYPAAPPAVTVSKARFVRYFIDASDPAHPTLMVDRMGSLPPQPVADDIEDMQFTFGLDTNADGVVDTWTAAPGDPSQIRQVRLELVARTRFPETGWSEVRTGIGNRPAGTTPDGYRRRTYDIVIDVRNSGVTG